MLEKMNQSPNFFPILFLILVVLVPYWKLTTMQGVVITDDVFTSDIMNVGFPYQHVAGEALKHGELPQWMPEIFGGLPLLTMTGVFYPINLILYWLLPSYVALNYSILLILIVAAVGMYLFAREIKTGIAGALVAAVSFAYSGFMVCHLKHESLVGAACFAPLGLYCIEKALKARDGNVRFILPLVFLSLIFGAQNLTGHNQVGYYSGLLYIAYFLFRMLKPDEEQRVQRKRANVEASLVRGPARSRLMVAFVVALLLGAGLSAIQVIPTYEMVTFSPRAGGVSFNFASNYAYNMSNFKTFFYPYANGDIGDGTYRGNSIFWEDYGYTGLITLLLAAYGSTKRWRNRLVKFFVACVVIGYLMVLGPNTPLYEAVFYVIPGMKFFRFPTRFLFIVNASIGILAAFGADQLVARFKGKKQQQEVNQLRFGRMEFVVIGLVVLDLLYFQMRQNPIVDAKAWRSPPLTAQILQKDTSLYRVYSLSATEAHKAAFSKAKGWEGDLQPYIDQREFLQTASNALYGLSAVDGNAPLTPNYIVDLWGDHTRGGFIISTAALEQGVFVPRKAFLKILSMFNVKYFLSAWPFKSDGVELVTKAANVFVYKNPSVFPRAFVVNSYRLAATTDEAKNILISDDFDPSREVILYENPEHFERGQGGTATATIEEYKTSEVTIKVTAESDAFLVLSDSYYPGWKAEVDGVETMIFKANICQRAVRIPSGNHVVRFAYESSMVRAGLWTTAGSLCVLLGAIVVIRIRRV